MFEQLRRTIYPWWPKPSKICILCQQYHQHQDAVCPFCCALLVPLGFHCQYCALPLSTGESAVCGECCLARPNVDRVITAYHYAEPLRSLLHSFKYSQGLYLTSFLINLMLQAPFELSQTDCLIPVPMHPKRLRQRGYNQAAVLAKQLSHQLNVPYVVTGCKKVLNTLPQAGLDSRQRRMNLKGAFVSKQLDYQRVTLIDDLYTTGSTAHEIAKTLKKQGVEKVDIWCCARAGKDRGHHN